jgi:hypothetical protein
MASPLTLAIDAGLLTRFRAAGEKITWRSTEVGRRPKGRRSRIARLDDEEARIEEVPEPMGVSFRAESGPVGALVLLLEVDGRGPPDQLESWDAGRDPDFPAGAIVARWGPDPKPTPSAGAPRMKDLIELARFALR